MEVALKYATTPRGAMNVIVDQYSNWQLMEKPVIVSNIRQCDCLQALMRVNYVKSG